MVEKHPLSSLRCWKVPNLRPFQSREPDSLPRRLAYDLAAEPLERPFSCQVHDRLGRR